jgi:hypothetical protein
MSGRLSEDLVFFLRPNEAAISCIGPVIYVVVELWLVCMRLLEVDERC